MSLSHWVLTRPNTLSSMPLCSVGHYVPAATSPMPDFPGAPTAVGFPPGENRYQNPSAGAFGRGQTGPIWSGHLPCLLFLCNTHRHDRLELHSPSSHCLGEIFVYSVGEALCPAVAPTPRRGKGDQALSTSVDIHRQEYFPKIISYPKHTLAERQSPRTLCVGGTLPLGALHATQAAL